MSQRPKKKVLDVTLRDLRQNQESMREIKMVLVSDFRQTLPELKWMKYNHVYNYFEFGTGFKNFNY